MPTLFSKFLLGSILAALLNGGVYYYLAPTEALKAELFNMNSIAILLTMTILLESILAYWLLKWDRWWLILVKGLLHIANRLGLILSSMVCVLFTLGDPHMIPLLLYVVNAWWISLQSNENASPTDQDIARQTATNNDLLDDHWSE